MRDKTCKSQQSEAVKNCFLSTEKDNQNNNTKQLVGYTDRNKDVVVQILHFYKKKTFGESFLKQIFAVNFVISRVRMIFFGSLQCFYKRFWGDICTFEVGC